MKNAQEGALYQVGRQYLTALASQLPSAALRGVVVWSHGRFRQIFRNLLSSLVRQII